MKLGLLATAAVLALVGGLMVAQVSAQEPSLSVGDGEAAPGDDVTVQVIANVPDGLGAWTLDISYDPDVATATDCEGDSGGVCSPDYLADGDTVRVTGASPGLDEESVLADITFTCADAEGETDLTVAVSVFQDAGVGDASLPIDITPSNGSISCAEPAPPADTAVPTAIIAGVGSGGPTDGDSGLGWVIAALAGAGVAGIAAFGALRLRGRSS